MRNITTLLLLLSSVSIFSQNNFDEALKFQNQIREYFGADELTIDSNLSKKAQQYSEELANKDDLFLHITDDESLIKEAVYKAEKYESLKNPIIDASIYWLLNLIDREENQYYLFANRYNKIGFGFAENNDRFFVVALFQHKVVDITDAIEKNPKDPKNWYDLAELQMDEFDLSYEDLPDSDTSVCENFREAYNLLAELDKTDGLTSEQDKMYVLLLEIWNSGYCDFAE